MTKPHFAPGIILSNASLRFQHKLLFENLSLNLPSGTVTCLLGPSGVGKTTLLRMLAGLPLFGRGEDKLQWFPHFRSKPVMTTEQKILNPLAALGSQNDSRKERLKTQNVGKKNISNDVSGCSVKLTSPPNNYINQLCQGTIATSDGLPLAERVTYMGQTDLLLPWLSVLDNVILGSYLRNQTHNIQIKAHALRILESVGLGANIHHKPATLSGGMKQRTALARTLMEEKPVVLMDEPFSALDAITRYDMQTLAAEKLIGKTVLLITHDPWEALRLSHQILVLRGQPAHLSQPIIPPELPPRDLTHAALLPLQKLLLNELNMVGVV